MTNSIDQRLERLKSKIAEAKPKKDLTKLSYQQKLEANVLFRNVKGCMICGLSFRDRRKMIDHCHTTGVVRGLICFSCNTALGHFKDDIDVLKSAIRYLERFKFNPDLIED
jgi:hypothetical protein